jgi:hypothetical protein
MFDRQAWPKILVMFTGAFRRDGNVGAKWFISLSVQSQKQWFLWGLPQERRTLSAPPTPHIKPLSSSILLSSILHPLSSLELNYTVYGIKTIQPSNISSTRSNFDLRP